MVPTPTSELDAINSMLSVIGESPVNNVDDTGLVDAVMARNILRETSREVQSRGWHWNTDRGLTLSVSYPEGFIFIPENTLLVDTAETDALEFDVVQRGNRLYDRRKHTYKFSRALKVDVVWLLPFEDIPQQARHYIMVRAGRIFQDRIVGSEQLNGFNAADEARAWTTLRAAATRTAGHNLARGSYGVMRILNRGHGVGPWA